MTPAEFRAARKSLGLRQDQIAPYLGIGDRAYISRIENGDSVPKQVAIIMRYLIMTPREDWVI